MNERIKQLALEAGDHVNEVYTAPVRSKTPGKIWEDGHISWHTQFNKKFAELIVWDCIEAIDAKEYTMGGDTEAKGMRFSINIIKKHFGVEE